MTTAWNTGPAADGRTVNSVERALDVLLLFSRTSAPSLGVSEIGRELGLSKAVVHRILTALCSRQVVTVDASSRRYVLGPASLALGRAFLARVDIRELATEPLRRLSARSNETSTLSIRVGSTRIYLRDELRMIRERGFAVSFGERQSGAASLAAPVFDHEGVLVALSVCGPVDRIRGRVDELSVLLLSEVRALSARLGHPTPDGRS